MSSLNSCYRSVNGLSRLSLKVVPKLITMMASLLKVWPMYWWFMYLYANLSGFV